MAEQPVKVPVNELDRWSMFTPAPGVENRNSKLSWCIRAGNPRITVYTQIPTDQDKGYGMINAPMDPATFLSFLSTLEAVALSPTPIKYQLKCETSRKDADGVSSKFLLSTVMYGKGEDGIIWLSVIAEDRPKIVFNFTISNYHVFSISDRGPLTASEASKLQTLTVVKALTSIYHRLTSDFRVKQPYDPNKPRSYGTTYPTTKPALPADFSNDLPF